MEEFKASDIEKLRKEKGLSRQDIFQLFGIPPRTLENWEKGINEPPQWALAFVITALNNLGKADIHYTYKDEEVCIKNGIKDLNLRLGGASLQDFFLNYADKIAEADYIVTIDGKKGTETFDFGDGFLIERHINKVQFYMGNMVAAMRYMAYAQKLNQLNDQQKGEEDYEKDSG